MKRALLLQNLMEFPSMSVRRYAEALCRAMEGVAERSGWAVRMPEVHQSAGLAKVVGGSNASRWARLVRYPKLIKGWREEMERVGGPGVCHVLDHSHANLLKACDPTSSVITVHDVIPMMSALGELDFRVKRRVRYTFPRKLRQIEKCAAVIAISHCTKRLLLRFADMPAERVHVVHHGVSSVFDGEVREGEREAVRERHGIEGSRRVVLHVCTRNRYKNSPALLRMLRRLPDEFVLLRVGVELFEDERALADDLGVSGRVINAGRVEGDAGLAAYYRSADAFAFPSTFEGFGWPPLEAMACGCPVVAGDAASLPEVVGDDGEHGPAGGLLVDPQDDQALASAVERLVGEREAFRAKSLARAARFTWDACAMNTAGVYDAVVGGGAAR
ncbi:MAG: glycosyltransferase family 1 protein [Planctomycetota bacterium]